MQYRVPFVNVPAHFESLHDEVLEVIDTTLRRGNVILRRELREFETQFAALLGARFAVGVNSGTDALHLALRATGIGLGDEVITVSHTCIATVAAIVNAGASPMLVDVADDFNMDVEQAERAIGPRTRAIIPVHLNGRAADIARVMQLAHDYNLTVIEDAAQALGAKFDGRMVGAFGAVGCFSLYPFKMLGAFGDGGIVVTDDRDVANKIALLRDYGEDRETGEIRFFGFNSRLDNLQAAILSVKLKYLPKWIARRRQVAEMYRRGLSEISELRLPHYPGERHFDVYLNYSVRAQRRDELAAYLKDHGVEPLTPISLVKPLHQHAALGLERFRLPMTEQVAREFIYLPINPEITDDQVSYVVDCIRGFYQ